MIIWAIARTTVGDAIRKKILQIFIAVTVALIILSLSFSQTLAFSTKSGVSSDLMMLKSFGQGMMAVAGLLISVVLGVSLIPQEFERRTIYTILAKPVNRWQFIIGKFLGASLTLALSIGVMGAVFLITLLIKAATGQQDLATATSAVQGVGTRSIGIWDPSALVGVILIFLQFFVLSSVVLFFSVIMSQTVNFFMGTGVYIMGVMAAVTESLGHAEKAAPALQMFYKVLYWIVPNFDKFNVTNEILHPDRVNNLSVYTLGMAGYSLLYVLIMMLLAIIAFERKEV